MTSSDHKTAALYVVRHGETIGNTQKIIFHPNEDVLNDAGRNQARHLAETLKDVKFTKVYTSNYPRTQETSSIILSRNEFDENLAKVDPRIRELGLPSFHGKPYSYLLKGIIEFLKSERPIDEFKLDDSEPVPLMRLRAREFIHDLINDIKESVEPQSILIVSHGALIKILMECLSNTQEFDNEGWDPCGIKVTRNTGCMKLSISLSENSKPQIKFQKLHDFSHLPKEMLENDSLTRLAQTPEGKCLSGCLQV